MARGQDEKESLPVVLVVSPGAYSHVVIMREFAVSLQQLFGDRYEVVAATSGGDMYREMFEARNLRTRVYSNEPFSRKEFSQQQSRVTDPVEALRLAAPLFAKGYRESFDGIKQIFDEEKPVFVVNDWFSLATFDLADARGIQSAAVGFLGMFGFEGEWTLPGGLGSVARLADMSSFVERFKQHVYMPASLVLSGSLSAFMTDFNAVRRSFGFEKPRAMVEYLSNRLLFVPSPLGFEYSRQLSPLVHVLGFVQSNADPLQERDRALLRWIDDEVADDEQLVYLAFGSHVHMEQWQLDTLIEGTLAADDSVRMIVVLRTDTDLAVAERHAPRVRVEQWVHQRAVLEHRRVRAFVSHCGLTSVAETVHARTPIMCLPLLGDQYGNAARANDAGIGLSVDNKASFSVDDVRERMRALLAEPSRQKFVGALEHLLKINSFAGGSDRAAHLVHQAIELGTVKHLASIPDEFPLYARNGYDIIAALLAIVVVAPAILIFFAIRCALRLCRSRSTEKSKKD